MQPQKRESCHLQQHTCVLSRFSSVQLFVTPWTVPHQPPLSTGFFWQEYWSGLPCPPPGDLPNLGTEPLCLRSPALAAGFFTASATWKAHRGGFEGTPIWELLSPTVSPEKDPRSGHPCDLWPPLPRREIPGQEGVGLRALAYLWAEQPTPGVSSCCQVGEQKLMSLWPPSL